MSRSRTTSLETTTEITVRHLESALKRAADDAVKKLLSRPQITETDGSVWIDVTDLVNERKAHTMSDIQGIWQQADQNHRLFSATGSAILARIAAAEKTARIQALKECAEIVKKERMRWNEAGACAAIHKNIDDLSEKESK